MIPMLFVNAVSFPGEKCLFWDNFVNNIYQFWENIILENCKTVILHFQNLLKWEALSFIIMSRFLFSNFRAKEFRGSLKDLSRISDIYIQKLKSNSSPSNGQSAFYQLSYTTPQLKTNNYRPSRNVFSYTKNKRNVTDRE